MEVDGPLPEPALEDVPPGGPAAPIVKQLHEAEAPPQAQPRAHIHEAGRQPEPGAAVLGSVQGRVLGNAAAHDGVYHVAHGGAQGGAHGGAHGGGRGGAQGGAHGGARGGALDGAQGGAHGPHPYRGVRAGRLVQGRRRLRNFIRTMNVVSEEFSGPEYANENQYENNGNGNQYQNNADRNQNQNNANNGNMNRNGRNYFN
ncbi:hypothetical protein QAD02_020312 [Eretmocerus hayati]|uniref:Uncharacterized protein n=1 Tax=Eretmocerus hayati TaxID=131215 RepID=A0ACC2PLP7_9HYME|nr:hypothetical protein QAD02_020312 [Eretmocerus hayati]